MNWLTLFVFLLVPPIGIFLYQLSSFFIRKKPLFLSHKKIFLWLIIAILTTSIVDFIGKWTLDPEAHTKLKKALLFHITIFKPKRCEIDLPKEFIQASPQKHHKHFCENKKPNLFLFVVETFRKDYINETVTPCLYKFSTENISFPLSLANANASPLSWFSIFNGHLPYHWKSFQQKKGSLGIQHLRELGYQIHVYSSADLTYFNMKELIFGKDQQLVDYHDFSKTNLRADQRDLMTLQALQKDLKQTPQNEHAFIVFLDSTHSEYYWPESFPTKFTPIIDKIDYLTFHPIRDDLEKIKNRYRNSIHFVDHLFSNFFSFLKKFNLYDSSMIVVTGDHAEEFFEHGCLFHGSHLNLAQIHVPMIYKLPHGFQRVPKATITSHIDIFPSIFDVITATDPCEGFFEGISIFSEKRKSHILAFQQNGGDTPHTFFLHNGTYMMTAQLLKNPDGSYKIEILSIRDKNEKQIIDAFAKEEIIRFFYQNFSQAFTSQ